jgi:hypothetical protein
MICQRAAESSAPRLTHGGYADSESPQGGQAKLRCDASRFFRRMYGGNAAVAARLNPAQPAEIIRPIADFCPRGSS